MSCACCYKITLAECPDAITLQGGMQANTSYYYLITDKFGNKYGKTVTSDESGYITIDASDFPTGLFMHFSGQFELKVYPNETASLEADTEIELVLCVHNYSCVIIEFSEDDETYGTVIPDCEQVQTPIANDELPSVTPQSFCDAVRKCVQTIEGKSAYDVAVENGFEGTEQEWLESLVGPKGDKGDTGDTGPAGPQGLKGDKGDTGDTGPQGPQGPQGLKGDKGDKGDTGNTGATGANGADGSVWRNGSGAPSNALGVNGDYYLDTATGDVYRKSSGAYSVVGNIKGATGATGATGPQGPTGATGATGAAGANGLNADMTRTSTTSNTIGTGSKSFTFSSASSNLGWLVGTRIRATATAGNFMSGVITAVSTTAVTINMDYTTGSGTYTSWNLSIAGEVGATGPQGSSANILTDIRTKALYFDDFEVVGTISTTAFIHNTFYVSYGGSWQVSASVETGHQYVGAARVNTLNSSASMGFGSNGFMYQTLMGAMVYETRVRFEDLSTSSDRFTYYAGLLNTASFNGNNRLRFNYSDNINSGKFQLECNASGVSTVLDSGITVAADQWYVLRIVMNASGNSVEFFIDGVSVGTINTNIPSNGVNPFTQINRSTYVNARQVYVDYQLYNPTVAR